MISMRFREVNFLLLVTIGTTLVDRTKKQGERQFPIQRINPYKRTYALTTRKTKDEASSIEFQTRMTVFCDYENCRL